MNFAIARQTGLMYEGRGGSFLPLVPTPMLSHARIVDPEHPAANEVAMLTRFESQPGLIFREDQFDPVTRTRRGRLYQGGAYSAPTTTFYALPHPHEVPVAAQMVVGRNLDMYVYVTPSDIMSKPEFLYGVTLGLGSGTFETRWRVVGVEMVGHGDILVTLRSLSVMGVLPDLLLDAIPVSARDEVKSVLDKVVTAALREAAGSVIDQCRHALTIVVSTWLFDRGGDRNVLKKDLGELCKLLEASDRKMQASTAWVVARLHNKTKPSARAEHGLSAPVDDDAQFCLQALGLVLREFGWARGWASAG